MNIPFPPQIKSHPGVIQAPMPLQPAKINEKNIIITHNRSRRKNKPGNIALASFIGEVPPVGAVLATVSE